MIYNFVRYLKNNFTQIATCLPVQNFLSEKVSKVDCEVNNIIIIYLINNGYVPISATIIKSIK